MLRRMRCAPGAKNGFLIEVVNGETRWLKEIIRESLL